MNGVIHGCVVTATGGPSVIVAPGSIAIDGQFVDVAASAVTIAPNDSHHSRLDLVAVDRSGAVRVIAGVPAVLPEFEPVPKDVVVIAAVIQLSGGDTTTYARIVDKRVYV